MSICEWTRSVQGVEAQQSVGQGLPSEVVLAQSIDWSVHIDAYLFSAARMGDRYVAVVYGDGSKVSEDGMTVATPPVRCVAEKEGFKLIRSANGDHYVITSEQGS